jgi:hypothetical protein
VLSIIFIREGSPSSLLGKPANCARPVCARHWSDNQACTASQRKLPTNKSMIWSAIFAGQMADVYERFFGSAIKVARLHRRNCRRKSLIPLVIRPKRLAGRGHPPPPRLRRTGRPRLQRRSRLQYRFFVRNRAICSWQNAEKSSKAKTRETHDGTRAALRAKRRNTDL